MKAAPKNDADSLNYVNFTKNCIISVLRSDKKDAGKKLGPR